jgi:two-component system response regulator NreC
MASHLHLASNGSHQEPAVSAPVRVVLADDHALMRRTLREVLDAEPAIEVVAVTHDLDEAARAVEEQHPDVLVSAVSTHEGAGVEELRALRARNPSTQVVVLASDDSAVRVQRVREAGALGYVLKEMADTELPEAVRAAAHGEEYVTPRVGMRLGELYSSLTDDRITPREVEVLRLIALGHTSVEVARKLKLSPRTIETHRAHIHRKLGLATRAQLVRYALNRGLLRI